MNINKENPWHAFGLVSAIGLDLAIMVIIGMWIGKKLDLSFQSSPLFLIIGLVLGFTIGIISIIRLIKIYLED
ncbi:MAG: AtpZ/AtpI family protein [Vulcanibacillus sp.]